MFAIKPNPLLIPAHLPVEGPRGGIDFGFPCFGTVIQNVHTLGGGPAEVFAINPYPLLIPAHPPVGGPLGGIDFGCPCFKRVI